MFHVFMYDQPDNRKSKKVRTLLVAIFGVRFIMVGMEVVVPLVTSRTRNAAAKSKTGSVQKVCCHVLNGRWTRYVWCLGNKDIHQEE